MAKVSKETERACQSFRQHRVLGTLGFQLDQVQRLLARGQQPAQRIGQRKSHALSGALVQRSPVSVGRDPQMAIRPQPQLHRSGESARARPRTVLGNPAHFGNPLPELRKEQLVGHGDAEIATLHRLGALVGRFQLRVHPLVSQEAGTVFGDPVAAHQA